MKSRNCHGFAISRVVFLMNRTGGGKKHTRAGGKKWRVVDSLVKGLQEFFGMVFRVIDARFEGEKRRIIAAVELGFEIHEGLPGNLKMEIVQGGIGLFQDIPVWFHGFVAVDG